MTELVDNLVPSQQGQPVAPTTPANPQGGDKPTEKDPYVIQLEEQTKRYKRQWNDMKTELSDYKSELQRLRGHVEGISSRAPDQDPVSPRNIEEFSDKQLEDAVEEAGQSGNWRTMALALEERARRRLEPIIQKEKETTVSELEKKGHHERVLGSIHSEFFPDGNIDPDSELVSLAQGHYAALRQIHGEDLLKSVPELEEVAFRRAWRDLNGKQLQTRVSTLEQENQKLRMAQEQLERGGAERSQRTEEVREVLQSKGPKAALRALGNRMFSDQPR